jgi:phosphoglycolate phosphatase
MARTLILDLDGTLIDSAGDLRAALNRLMAAHGLPPFSRTAVLSMIGDGMEALVRRACAARQLPFDPAYLAAYRADYAEHLTVETNPYPGTQDVLLSMAADGWRLGVCTNKQEAAARDILRALKLDGLVDSITGGDGPRKPDPAHMLAAVAAAGGTPERALALGDHSNDVIAARGAGMGAIFAGWGYGPAAMAEGAAAIASAITEVPMIAARLLGPDERG